ncbi:MAG: hypothetical protein K2Q26_02295 [Bdellovibrionales bacterium]|nr:hypothetical protein [Bdellovibrionales bacterium]
MFVRSLIATTAILFSLNAFARLTTTDPNMSASGATNPYNQTNLNGTSANNTLPGIANIVTAMALAGGTSAPSTQAWLSPTGKPLSTNSIVNSVYNGQGGEGVSQ